MGYFEAIAASSFTIDSEGRPVLFPWGMPGMGYMVPTHQEYEQLRATLVWTYRLLIPTTLLLIVLFPR